VAEPGAGRSALDLRRPDLGPGHEAGRRGGAADSRVSDFTSLAAAAVPARARRARAGVRAGSRGLAGVRAGGSEQRLAAGARAVFGHDGSSKNSRPEGRLVVIRQSIRA
jgi:hypothetical protein